MCTFQGEFYPKQIGLFSERLAFSYPVFQTSSVTVPSIERLEKTPDPSKLKLLSRGLLKIQNLKILLIIYLPNNTYCPDLCNLLT
jgi:hypothetical protein